MAASPYFAKPMQSEAVKNPYNNRTYLVTGGAGFIGSNLCRALIKKGAQVICIDNLITGKRKNIADSEKNERFIFFEKDIVDVSFGDMLKGKQVTHIFHLACPTGVPNISRLAEEMLLTCSVGTRNVLEFAKKQNASLLATSTAEIYGQPEVSPQVESYTGNVDPTGARSPYEEGKRFMESLVVMYVRKYKLNAKLVRIFNTYGPGMSLDDTRVIPHFLRCIIDKRKLKIYGDGLQTRTLMFIDDAVRGLELILEKGDPGEVYNVGGIKQTTIRELANVVARLTGHTEGIEFTPHFIEDHKSRQPCTAKIRALGWEQSIELEEGIVRMVEAHGITSTSMLLEDVAIVDS